MPTPFPGMDPYLERADLWPNVHNSLIVALRDALAPRLRPRYYVAIEERIVQPGIDNLAFTFRPDVTVIEARPAPEQELAHAASQPGAVTVELPLPDAVRELYLEIREVGAERVITLLEILSPTNKNPGEGRRIYEQKRLNILGSSSHLVEIDLLRMGNPLAMRGYNQHSDYRILVSRSERRPRADLLPFSLRQPIPPFHLPLQRGDDEPLVDLTRLLHDLYDRAGYDLRIDYRAAPDPPLPEADAAWADALLREAGVR